ELAATTGADGTLYVIGGRSTDGVAQSTVYRFKPGTDILWQTAPAMPEFLESLGAATRTDGTLFAIGGSNPLLGGAQNTMYSFKPGTDTVWQNAPGLPAARDDFAATTGADGTIYVIGGEDRSFNPQSTVYGLTPGTSVTANWSQFRYDPAHSGFNP